MINNSWGQGTGCFGCAPPDVGINNAITNAVTQGRNGKGSIVVFSAGNTSNRGIGQIGTVAWPAIQANVISLSSISNTGAIANYSPRGTRVDVVAPSSLYTGGVCPFSGDFVTSQMNTTSCAANGIPGDAFFTNRFGGTSAAAPQVAAIAAILLTDNSALTFTQVRDRIKLRAVSWGAAQDFGSGKVDAFRTLRDDLTGSICGRTLAIIGNNTYTTRASGGLGPYSYHWYIAYGSGSTTFYDTGNTWTTITQNFVSGDVITFKVVITDQSGSVIERTKTASAP